MAGLVIAVLFAAGSGEERAFFLPGIWVDAACAVAFARLRRTFTVATVLWAVVSATRAVVQACSAEATGLVCSRPAS